MADLSLLRAGLSTNLATINGLRATATIPDNPTPPQAVVIPQSISYDTSFGRGTFNTFEFVVTLLVGRVDARSSQNALDAYCASTGSASIKQAIESERTLGSAASDCRVTGLRGISPLTIGDVTYLTADFAVTVYA